MKYSETANKAENSVHLKFGEPSDLFWMDYMSRKSHFEMASDHYHPFYEIYYLISGQRIYFIKDASYPVQAGDIVFIGKHELHKTLNLGEPSHDRIVFHFDDRFVRAFFGDQSSLLLSPFYQSSPVIRLPLSKRGIIQDHMKRVITEIQHKPVGCEIYLPHAITDLLLSTARFLQENEIVSTTHTEPIHLKIGEIVRYLNNHFAEPIQLTRLSKEFFISSHYLSRMFKKVTGLSLIDYVNLTRIKAAQRLLRETRISITEIAASVGFENFSHFGKTFRKLAGISARAYRQMNP